jgi:hypothetical protein
MAQINFLKKGEVSKKKNYIPHGTYRKRWKLSTIILGAINVLLCYVIYTHHIYSNFGR